MKNNVENKVREKTKNIKLEQEKFKSNENNGNDLTLYKFVSRIGNLTNIY